MMYWCQVKWRMKLTQVHVHTEQIPIRPWHLCLVVSGAALGVDINGVVIEVASINADTPPSSSNLYLMRDQLQYYPSCFASVILLPYFTTV